MKYILQQPETKLHNVHDKPLPQTTSYIVLDILARWHTCLQLR